MWRHWSRRHLLVRWRHWRNSHSTGLIWRWTVVLVLKHRSAHLGLLTRSHLWHTMIRPFLWNRTTTRRKRTMRSVMKARKTTWNTSTGGTNRKHHRARMHLGVWRTRWAQMSGKLRTTRHLHHVRLHSTGRIPTRGLRTSER